MSALARYRTTSVKRALLLVGNYRARGEWWLNDLPVPMSVEIGKVGQMSYEKFPAFNVLMKEPDLIADFDVATNEVGDNFVSLVKCYASNFTKR